MNSFKRASVYLKRTIGKVVLLFSIVFLLGTLTAGAVSVRIAINNTTDNLIRNMRPIVTTQRDHASSNDYWFEMYRNYGLDLENRFVFERIQPNHIREIGQLDYVYRFNYSILNTFFSFDLMTVENPEIDYWYHFPMPGDMQPLALLGVSEAERIMQIEHGYLELVRGNEFSLSHFTSGQPTSVALVSLAFAEYNNLEIGSVFNAYHLIMEPFCEYGFCNSADIYARGRYSADIYAQTGMAFEVIGLFDIPLESTAEAIGPTEICPRRYHINRIIVPSWAVEDVLERVNANEPHLTVWESFDLEIPLDIHFFQDLITSVPLRPVFQLHDPFDLEEFKLAAIEILPPHYYFISFVGTFDIISGPLQTTENIFNWVLIGAVVTSILVLSLLILLFLRERKQEIGIYLALGEHKRKIVSQMLIEIFIPSILAITLAIFTGGVISSEISRNILRRELITSIEQRDEHYRDRNAGSRLWTSFDRVGIPPTNLTFEQMAEAFDVSINLEVIVLIYFIGMSVIGISAATPILIVMKSSPKEILINAIG